MQSVFCGNKSRYWGDGVRRVLLAVVLALGAAGTAQPTQAATLPLEEIAVGKIVTVNGMKFAKTGVDPVKGSQFTAICESNACSGDPHCTACSTLTMNACEKCEDGYMVENGVCVPSTMQEWTGCATLPNPSCMAAGNCKTTTDRASLWTQGPILTDARDGKSYEVRKFPDGKCWMVDNLRYGGSSTSSGSNDFCYLRTTTTDNGMGTGTVRSDWYGQLGSSADEGGTFTGMYGDCRDPAGGGPYGSVTGEITGEQYNMCLDNPNCGYKYNFQAAVQSPNCNYNNGSCSLGSPTATANFVQGICPKGWHLPSGGTTAAASEFVNLDMAIGGTGANVQATPRTWLNFWKNPAGGWKWYPDGWVSNATNTGWGNAYHGRWTDNFLRDHWWSGSISGAASAYYLYVDEYDYYPQNVAARWIGSRCVVSRTSQISLGAASPG